MVFLQFPLFRRLKRGYVIASRILLPFYCYESYNRETAKDSIKIPGRGRIHTSITQNGISVTQTQTLGQTMGLDEDIAALTSYVFFLRT